MDKAIVSLPVPENGEGIQGCSQVAISGMGRVPFLDGLLCLELILTRLPMVPGDYL